MREYNTNSSDLRSVSGDWGVWYRYTHGVAGEKFFQEMKASRQLTGSVCPKCKRTFVPASMYCEDCFVQMTEYRPVGDTGTVASFTVLHESLEETPLAEPLVAAFVQFDGVAGGLLAPLRGVQPGQVQIGMKVKAVIDKEQPTGTIVDLAWVPA
jgi:uncharacterized OB-fold protein